MTRRAAAQWSETHVGRLGVVLWIGGDERVATLPARNAAVLRDPMAHVVHDVCDQQRAGRRSDEQVVERMPAFQCGGSDVHLGQRDVELQHVVVALRLRRQGKPLQEISHRLVARQHEAAERLDSALLRRGGEPQEQQACGRRRDVPWQPPERSAGQGGNSIQDRVSIVTPDGKRYRYLPSS